MEHDIQRPVRREDVPYKISGDAKYIADYKFEDMLYACTLRSSKARARIKSIEYPALPEGYNIVDRRDVPGRNRVRMLIYDQPFFAEDAVNYAGEPIALIVGTDKKKISDILSRVKIEYEELEPILTMEEGMDTAYPIYGKNNCFGNYEILKGDMESARERGIYVYEGEYETGYQEQFYLETQGVIGTYEDGKITIYGSMQCPYYVKNAVVECLGLEPDKVRIVQATTGGAFGGKEDYPSLIAGQVACAALKVKRPVRLILDRNEDIEFTTKRHPSKIKLKSYIDENHKVIGMEADINLDGGAYAGLSGVVLQRAMFASAGVYNIENLIIKGRAIATNKAVSGAFRGFGAPQAFFAIEMHMEHAAKEIGLDPVNFKMRNALKQGNKSSTGGIFREGIPLPKMVDRVLEMSSYREKKRRFEKERKNGKLKGIGLSLFFHGGGFTGNGERDHIKGSVKLVRYPDRTVEILAAGAEMGQGVKTTLRKIAAQALGIPMDIVMYKDPDTDRVPDSGPTVASRTVLIVGKLICNAAEQLKSRWDEEGVIEVSANYEYPEGFSWDNDILSGDAYTSYSWGANAVEVGLDPVTLESTITGVWSVYDIGKAIDEIIVQGQIDGGIVQGLGYASIEVVENKEGRFLQRSSTDCVIPTAMDVPEIKSELICEPHEYGPFGAKALGELTFIGSPAAYAMAVENALGINVCKIPVRTEYLLEVIANGK